jgi:hypothetical protein
MSELNSTRAFKFKSVVVTDKKGEQRDITALSASFSYGEKITSPFVSGSLVVIDSAGAFDLIAFSGGEKVSITLTDTIKNNQTQDDVLYELYVWKVGNRFVQDQKQHYTLGLISREAIINEGLRVQSPLQGKPEKIIDEDLLKGVLKTSKDVFTDPSQFEIKLLPNRRRPFDIIHSITSKTVPQQKKWGTGTISANSANESINGTAGYFFWESKKGFNFYSIDALCKLDNEDRPPWGPYVDVPANDDYADPQFTVLRANFTSEIDVMSNLRVGKYSSLMIFFNPSTGQYDEYAYNLKDSYEKMEHLGSGELDLIPTSEIELSEYPTRFMSTILDHETWFAGATPADPESEAGSSAPAPFADWQKYFTAQSLSRYTSLTNQRATVVIPGNSEICAGDLVDIQLKSKLPTDDRNKEPYDLESSGVYLIDEVIHQYSRASGANGKFETTLVLLRDAYGVPDTDSNH